MKKTIALLLALVMLFALAACGSSGSKESENTDKGVTNTDTPSGTPSDAPSDEPAELTGDPIKIGHIVDLTGAEAMTGEEAKKALEFAVESLGGGIAGHPVEIIIGDAQCSTSGAVDVARMMVEEHQVVAILGPTQAGQKTAVSEYVKEAGVPLIFYSGTPSYLFATNEWLIGAGGANPQMTVMADYAYNDLGYRKVHTLTMDNVGFRAFTDDFTKAFTALGGEVISAQYAPLPCSDWAPYLASMSEADAIMAWTTGSNAIALWTAWYEMGVYEKMPMQGVMGSAFTDYYILAALNATDPAMAEAVLGTASPSAYSYDVPNDENKTFVEAWKAEFGAIPQTNLPGQCYQAFLLLKTAIESIDGETDPEKVRDAILACDITGPTGRLAFDGSGAGIKDMYILEVVKLEDGSYNYEIVKTYQDVPPSGLLG